ncbi:MAG: OmpA family protein [Bacteroidales bacterium]|nr:OmpA family protein [Bacteroidales bacterium]
MRRTIRSLILLALITLSPKAFPQEPSRDFIRAVQDADVAFYFYEDYTSAAKAYERLYASNPGNHNLAAKLGICYLKTGDRFTEAIPLLRYATANQALSDSEYLEYGSKAPVETLYYLAFAYHISDSLEQALDIYSELLRKPSARGDLKVEYINRQLEACRLAIKAIETPARIRKEIFFQSLNNYPGALNPVVSGNDSVFLFTLPVNDESRIFCSYRTPEWSEPVDISNQLGGFPEMYTNSITADGRFLVVNVFTGASGSLYYSRRTGERWSKLTRFPKPVTTKYWEAHGFISPDGQRLWFTSNRPGGMGELDIYVTKQTTPGSWSDPVNMGSIINTPYNDNAPFMDEKDGTLWFSSEGHSGIGGYDIFKSVSDGQRWSKPVILPYPVNTTGDNTFLGLTANRKGFLLIPGNAGSISGKIHLIEVDGFTALREVTITGTVTAGDGIPIDTTHTRISLIDPGKPAVNVSISGSNDFRTVTTPGEKLLVVESSGYKTDTILITIDSSFALGDFKTDMVLVPEKVDNGEFLTLSSVLFEFDSYALSPDALVELGRIAGLIQGQSMMTVEVTGYTDAKGTYEYNLTLSARRAAAVVDFFKQIPVYGVDFRIRSEGASGFVAVNSNPDGTDNPSGRAYNRRVTIGIVNPGTGVTLTRPVYVPDHLRHPHSSKYGIKLFSSAEKYYPDYFSSLGSAEMYFVRPVVEDTAYIYVLGDFLNRTAAVNYLPRVVEAGFTMAEVISLYEVENDDSEPLKVRPGQVGWGRTPVYTIQLFAGRKISDPSVFKDVEFTILLGKDGLYRYITGEFQGFSDARKELERLKAAGFTDAFIRDLRLLPVQNREIIVK